MRLTLAVASRAAAASSVAGEDVGEEADVVEGVRRGQRGVRPIVEQGQGQTTVRRAQRDESHGLEGGLSVRERPGERGHGRTFLEPRHGEPPQLVQVYGAPLGSGERVRDERREHQDLRRVGGGEEQARVGRARRPHEDAQDALGPVLDLALPRPLLGQL